MLHVYPVEVSNIVNLSVFGHDHPIYGAFFELGFHLSVTGVPTQVSAYSHICGQTFEDLMLSFGCQATKDVEGRRWFGSQLIISPKWTNPEERVFHRYLQPGVSICILFFNSLSNQYPICLFAGSAVKDAGRGPPCDREDIWETWLGTIGIQAQLGNNVLEQDLSAHTNSEEQLLERLKQLYGGV